MRAPDLTGQKFGLLTVVSRAANSSDNRRSRWNCVCECGGVSAPWGKSLRSGNTTSCGCLKREAWTKASAEARHGMSHTPTFRSWSAMRERCTNPKVKEYKHYGARGISICAEWTRFEQFYADMGDRPAGTTLDRINVNGNYEPGNCRWADAPTQARNRTNSRYLSFNGEVRPMAEWAELKGVRYTTLRERLLRGWPVEKALDMCVIPHRIKAQQMELV